MKPIADRLITCISQLYPGKLHEAITHLGNPAAPWRWTIASVIRSIEAKAAGFYIVVNGRQSDIAIVRPRVGQPYLKALANGLWNEDLLELTSCPLPA